MTTEETMTAAGKCLDYKMLKVLFTSRNFEFLLGFTLKTKIIRELLMKKTISLLLIISIFITSCTHTISRPSIESESDYYNLVNKRCEGRNDLRITTINGLQYEGHDLEVMADSTHFRLNETGKPISIVTKEIKSISYHKWFSGILEGFILGTLSGLAIVLGLMSVSPGGDAAMGSAIIATIVFPIGVVTGTLWGYFNPSEYVIEVN